MSHTAPALLVSPVSAALFAAGFLALTLVAAHLLHRLSKLSHLAGWLWASFAGLSLFLIVAPWLPLDDYHRRVFSLARSELMPWLYAEVGVLVLLGFFSHRLLGGFSATERRVRVGWWLMGSVLAAVAGVGLLRALVVIVEAAPERRLRIAHEAVVGVQEVEEFAALGGVELAGGRTALMREGETFYILTPDNVAAVGDDLARSRVFARAVPDLSDMLALPHMVLVVSGRTLGRSDGAGEFAKVADLPVAGLRFGQRAVDSGPSSEIILFGRLGDGGVVYGLKPDGQYLKIAEVDGPVTAAAGCYESTVAAVGDKLFSLTPGRRPALLFKTPSGTGEIVSVLARAGAAGGGCTYLVATADGVFALEGGVAHILVAGIGGELRIAEYPFADAYLADARRHAAVRLRLPVPRP